MTVAAVFVATTVMVFTLALLFTPNNFRSLYFPNEQIFVTQTTSTAIRPLVKPLTLSTEMATTSKIAKFEFERKEVKENILQACPLLEDNKPVKAKFRIAG